MERERETEMKVSCTQLRGLKRPPLGKCPGGRRWARSCDHSSNGEEGASPGEGKATQPVARRAGERPWELGPGTRT